MRAEWLLLLVAATHFGYEFTPYPWATMTAMLGAMTAVLAWHVRGRRFRSLWFVSLLGCIEGWQMYTCQMMLNWFPDPGARPFEGVCGVVFGLPFYRWGLGGLAVCACLIALERRHG